VRCKYALRNELVEASDKVEIAEKAIDVNDKKADDQLVEVNLESAYLGKMFDFYTKELIRLREEKKIMAVVMLTERIRKQKETCEMSTTLIYWYDER